MLTPQINQMQSKIHLHAIFCELQPNQRVLKYFSKFLHFQPALLWTQSRFKAFEDPFIPPEAKT